MTNLEKHITELNIVNRNMISSIRTLEQENDIYAKELQKLRGELNNKEASNTNKSVNVVHSIVGQSHTDTRTFSTMRTNIRIKRRQQALVIGDENVRGFASLIKSCTKNNFDVNCQWQKKMKFDDTINLCKQLSQKFTKEDYVIVLWGSDSAIKGYSMRGDKVDILLDACKHTNLILIGPPLYFNRPVLNGIIQEHNATIINTLERRTERIYFLPLLYLTDSGLLNYVDKSNLVKHLCSRLHVAMDFKDATNLVNGDSRSTSANVIDFGENLSAEIQNANFLPSSNLSK